MLFMYMVVVLHSPHIQTAGMSQKSKGLSTLEHKAKIRKVSEKEKM